MATRHWPRSRRRAPLLKPTATRLRPSLTAMDVGDVVAEEKPLTDSRDVLSNDGLPFLSGLSWSRLTSWWIVAIKFLSKEPGFDLTLTGDTGDSQARANSLVRLKIQARKTSWIIGRSVVAQSCKWSHYTPTLMDEQAFGLIDGDVTTKLFSWSPRILATNGGKMIDTEVKILVRKRAMVKRHE